MGVCSGTFHPNSQPRKPAFPKALVAGGTRVGHEEVLPPCGHFLKLQLVYRHLLAPPIQKACGADNDSCYQKKVLSQVLQKGIPNTTDFQKPSFKGQFSSHPLTKERKNPDGHRTRCSASLIITGMMPIKMTTSNQIPSDSMGILSVCKQYMEERARR